ncbi:hypothetical protein [Blastococcus sp. SYSU DS0510]
MDRYLYKITDLEADLVEFGLAWVAPMADFPDHFALVRQMTAEVGHLPHELIESWQDAGPRRVMRELALRLKDLPIAACSTSTTPPRPRTTSYCSPRGTSPIAPTTAPSHWNERLSSASSAQAYTPSCTATCHQGHNCTIDGWLVTDAPGQTSSITSATHLPGHPRRPVPTSAASTVFLQSPKTRAITLISIPRPPVR